MVYYIEHDSPLGPLILAATDSGLCGLYFDKHRYFKGTAGWLRSPAHSHLLDASSQLDEYFAGKRIAFDVPLDMRGTEFQRAVWRELLSLPFGQTTSYQTIAQRIGRPQAVRATGTAIGRNPVCIFVPCHRVIGASGGLSGYAGGLERKHYLLGFELRKE